MKSTVTVTSSKPSSNPRKSNHIKTNVQKEMAQSFFKVRLWTQKELLAALFAQDHQLDEHLKAELPLKRIWTVAAQEE
jgi:restriction system protein